MATANVTKVDYYEVLSVSRDANDQELKTSYRKLAMQYHPDRNPDDATAEEKFKECSEAYQVLSDPEKRAAYDRYGHTAFQNGGGGGNPFTGGGFGGAQDLGDIFGDLFGEMFNMGGGNRRATRQQRGRDLKFDMKLEFEEAVFGVEREITIRRAEACEDCRGTGSAAGKQPETCQQCGGRGQIRSQQGFFSVARTCPICSGTGSVIRTPCTTCKGDSRVTREHKILVKVPAGVETDTRIRYSGEGEAGRFGGPAGDFYVVLDVKAHKFFERDGDDLHCVIPISFPQAALGTDLELETLDGVETIKVPEGTQSGREIKLRGKGVPHLNSHGKGDLIVEVRVQTPSKLTKQQKDLLKQLSETISVENTPASRGIFDKVKEIFS
jgi:molecular chaperone DnaJ